MSLADSSIGKHQRAYIDAAIGKETQGMDHHSIDLAPYRRVAIVDRDYVFRRRLELILKLTDLSVVLNAAGGPNTLDDMLRLRVDLAFIEVDGHDEIWCGMQCLERSPFLVVGTTLDNNGRDWLQAVRNGADTILLKQYYPHLVRPMLSRLFASPAAKRCKVVPISVGERPH